MDLPLENILLENCVAELSKLPGIGKKTALRLALNILRKDREEAHALGEAIIKMRDEIGYCKICHNISEKPVCSICSDTLRDKSLVCVVENIKDVLSVESTNEYHGLYHVLGGLISPLDGIGPAELEIDSLIKRVADNDIKEVMLALSPTMEGDTTSFYIYRKLSPFDINITTLARGISVGNELEFTDELTLGRSIQNRIPYQG